MISGLAVGGFGLGSIVFAPICTSVIASLGPNTTFLIQGAITLVGMLIGAPLMKAAPDGFKPEGWNPPVAAATGGYTLAFVIIGASCIIGAVMSIISKKPVYNG